jgi:hypothetical protein
MCSGYEVPVNHERKTKFLVFVFQSITRTNAVDMNSPSVQYITNCTNKTHPPQK